MPERPSFEAVARAHVINENIMCPPGEDPLCPAEAATCKRTPRSPVPGLKNMDAESPDFDAQLDLLVDVAVDYAIYMLDPEGRVVSWDPGAGRLNGLPREEIIGQQFSRFYPPEDRLAEVPKQALETARKEGRFSAEGWRVRKDGSRFWAEETIDPLNDPQGKLIGFAEITRNVTARREAKATLLASEAPLSAARRGGRRLCDISAGGRWHDRYLEPRRRAGEGLYPRRSRSAVISRFFTRPRTAPPAFRSARLRPPASEGRFEAEGWRVRKDGSGSGPWW